MLGIENSLKELINGMTSLIARARVEEPNGASTCHPQDQPPVQPQVQFDTFMQQPYSTSTKKTLIDFLKFDGSDFRDWAYRCKQKHV